MAEDLLFWFIACCFGVVSVALTIKIIFDAWLEYLQVREGIAIVRNHQQMEEGQDDDTDY
jgi:hypothetical protein